MRASELPDRASTSAARYTGSAGIRSSAPADWSDVVAVHADPAERPADADPNEDLGWFATQEVPDLLR